MNIKGARGRRTLVLLIVLMFHAALVLLAARPTRQRVPITADDAAPLMLLPGQAAAARNSARPAVPASRDHAPRRAKRPDQPLPDAAQMPEASVQPPDIDWMSEAQLAAQTSIAGAEQTGRYRDLSTLSPAQLDWIRKNHLQPAAPGIAWTHPRVEFDHGLPIIWINDHCVAVPALMLMVFCGIGHIEANGDLFKHMRDPRE